VECHGGRENNEVSDDIGKSHAYECVDLDASKIGGGLLRSAFKRICQQIGSLFFNFLRRLPKEKIWAESSTEDCDDRSSK
jgi:hypothetical protein